MQLWRVLFLVCCAVLGSGCHMAQGPTARYWVHLAIGTQDGVFLHSGGGGRIDSTGPYAGGPWLPHTVVVPCSSSEVERLAETIAGLIDMGAARPIGVSALYEGRRSYVLRCGTPKATREAQFNQLDIDMNLVWEGVMREINAVGHVALAEGVMAFLAGEQSRRDGDLKTAHDRYNQACQEFCRWGVTRTLRIEGAVFEPVPCVWDENGPDSDAVPYALKAWKHLTEEEFRMERQGGMTILSFTESSRERGVAEGMPAEVPEGVLKELKERPPPGPRGPRPGFLRKSGKSGTVY